MRAVLSAHTSMCGRAHCVFVYNSHFALSLLLVQMATAALKIKLIAADGTSTEVEIKPFMSKHIPRSLIVTRQKLLAMCARACVCPEKQHPTSEVKVAAGKNVLLLLENYLKVRNATEYKAIRWPLQSPVMADVCDRKYAEFIDGCNNAELYALFDVAKLMGMECLGELVQAKFASKILGIPPEMATDALNRSAKPGLW